MAGSEIVYRPAAFKKCIQDCRNAVSDIKKTYGNVTTECNNLAKKWDGVNQQSFASLMQDCEQAYNQFQTVLTGVADDLQSLGDYYGKRDQDMAARWKGK
jgi:WXG100 family type VII secretion target